MVNNALELTRASSNPRKLAMRSIPFTRGITCIGRVIWRCFIKSMCVRSAKPNFRCLPLEKNIFRKFMCLCINEPTADSCNNMLMDALASVMFSLSAFARNNSCLRNDFTTCIFPFHDKHANFGKRCNQRPGDVMKLALCDRAHQPHLVCTKKNQTILS